MEPLTMTNEQGQEFITDSPAELVQFRNQGFYPKTTSKPAKSRAAKTTTAPAPEQPGPSTSQ